MAGWPDHLRRARPARAATRAPALIVLLAIAAMRLRGSDLSEAAA